MRACVCVFLLWFFFCVWIYRFLWYIWVALVCVCVRFSVCVCSVIMITGCHWARATKSTQSIICAHWFFAWNKKKHNNPTMNIRCIEIYCSRFLHFFWIGAQMDTANETALCAFQLFSCIYANRQNLSLLIE